MSDAMQGSATESKTELQQAGQVAGDAGGRVKAIRRVTEALSDEQRQALGLLTEGKPIRDVGQKLGIHRGTIYRWLKRDPYFRAAYNGWQLEQQESCRAVLMKAAEKAVARVIESLPVDQNLAWRVIKELGILSRSGSLSVEPLRVEMEIAVERHEEESVLMERIEKELESDLPSPRGDLARFLWKRDEAERRDRQQPGSEQPEGRPAEPVAPAEVSREGEIDRIRAT